MPISFTKTTHAMLAVTAATLAAAAATAPAPADAATIAGVRNNNYIVWIDTDQKKVTGWAKLDRGASLIGIDVRPADGKLYGVTPEGAIVIVDYKTGKWEKKSQISEALPKGVTFTVDFNPVADRLRILTSAGTSYRINVEDGKTTVDGSLKYAEADANKGKQPKVIAGAYSNSFAGTKETALYDIDAANNTFLRQAPPNDGILNTLGKLGAKVNGDVAFDIVADGKGGNTGWMLMGGTLFTVDIATGATKSVGKIGGLTGKVTDIAVLPAM
jgi:Domain of unknown function (DUF4394)